jgi:hypothetical protein
MKNMEPGNLVLDHTFSGVVMMVVVVVVMTTLRHCKEPI